MGVKRLFKQRLPGRVVLLLWLALALQIFSRQAWFPNQALTAHYQPLPKYPQWAHELSVVTGKSYPLLAHLLALRLQLQDSQSGQHYHHRRIPLPQLKTWLRGIQGLNPNSDYPILLATRVYSQAADPLRQRQILLLAYELYQTNPQQFWPWLAEASVMARHQLNDTELALRFAKNLQALGEIHSIPHWVKDLHWLYLENVGYLQTAYFVVQKLLLQKDLDPDQKRFLASRLLNIEQALLKNQQSQDVFK